MKLIIDIPDEEYNQIKEWGDSITGYQTSLVLYRAVRNGIPYEERPQQGEWILMYCSCGDRYYSCSICNRVIEVENGQSLKDYPFCHCGAKMKGGAKE